MSEEEKLSPEDLVRRIKHIEIWASRINKALEDNDYLEAAINCLDMHVSCHALLRCDIEVPKETVEKICADMDKEYKEL